MAAGTSVTGACFAAAAASCTWLLLRRKRRAGDSGASARGKAGCGHQPKRCCGGGTRAGEVTLTYFDFPGVAEKLRLTLAVGGVAFNDVRLPGNAAGYAEVARRRAEGLLPFGQVPVATIGGVSGVFAQSNALLRYFGRLTGLYPDGVAALRCDMVLEALAELDSRLVPQHYGSAMARSPTTGKPCVSLSQEQRVAVATHLTQDVLPVGLARVERVLAGTPGPWFCDDTLTVCDLAAYVFVRGLGDGTYVAGIDGSKVLASCPGLQEHASRVAALPAVKKWLARPRASTSAS